MNRGLPEGVERFQTRGNLGKEHPRGEWIRAADLPAIEEAVEARVREEMRQELEMLGMMLRENQRHEENDRRHYDEKGKRTHPRRLMHDGKAAAYRHAEANLAPIIAALKPNGAEEGRKS